VFENHLIHYGYLEKDVDSNIDRINALEHSLWGTDNASPTGIRGDLNTYMSNFDQHLLDYGHLKNYSESNIHDIDTRLQIVEGGSSNEQENLRLKVDDILPGKIREVNHRVDGLETEVQGLSEIANGSAGIVNTLSDSVYSFSNTLDTFSEDFESLSNLLSNTKALLDQTLNASTGIVPANTADIRALENRFDPFETEFDDFSKAIINSNNVFTSDISSLSNIILEPTNGLSTLVSDLQDDLATLNGAHGDTYSLAVSLSNEIHDSHAGLSVRLDSNVDHTIRIHETDIPSIDSEISNIKSDLGMSDGGSGGSGTYLQKSTWDNWVGPYDTNQHYKTFYEQVNGSGGGGGIAKLATDNETSILSIEGDLSKLNNDLTQKIDNDISSITDIYTVSSGNDMRLSVSSGRMYIQKDNGGNWQNLHIFR
jgi:hypothetical protein